MLLNPNCSEAVMRIRTDKMNKEKKDKLLEELKKKFDSGENEETYDTYVSEEEVFGIPHIKISGDMPYNDSKKITEVLEKHDVSNSWVENEEE